MNTTYTNYINKSSLLLILLFAVTLSYAQSTGDYRSNTSGNWNTASTWQMFNGSAWVTASTYPGQNAGTYSVNILAGNIVTIPNAGISTNAMGEITIDGTLILDGDQNSLVTYSLQTHQISITGNLSPSACIIFNRKCILKLPTDAILKVHANGLQGNCNNNQEIDIGSNKYAACNGAPGYIFTFAQLMAGGGTINSIISATSTNICQGDNVQFMGSYSGAIASAPTYSWTSTGPGSLIFSPSSTSQNTTVTPTVAGLYSVMLTTTTDNQGVLYSNTESVILRVNQKSSDPTSAVTGSDSIMQGLNTTITLNGGGSGDNETVRWYSSSCGGTLVGSGNPLTVSPTVTTTYYGRYEDATPCGYNTNCANVTVKVNPFTNIWKGSLDTDFAKAGNWIGLRVPASGEDIYFDNNPLNNCILDGNRTVGNIINPSPKNLVTSAHQLAINGNLNFSGTGKIDAGSTGSTILFSGTQLQTVPAVVFLDTTIYRLNIQNISGVQLAGNLVIAENAIIQTGANLTIPVQQSLTVFGTIDNQAGVGGLLVKSSTLGNATLIFHNTAASPVQATIEMYSKASKATNYKWQFIGIPLRSMIASPSFDGSYVRQMYENDNPAHWYQLGTYSGLTSFTGYEITQVTPRTLYFQGELENKDFNSGKLDYTLGVTYPGQHLIGNPYTAAIDITKLGFGSTDPAIIENTVYLYNTGSYEEWTTGGSGTSSGTSAGQYIAVPIYNAGNSGLPAQIPSMQAFLLRVKSDNSFATISIPYSATGTILKNTELQRMKAVVHKVSMKIEVTGTHLSDRMWIFIDPGFTNSFDNGWDGYKFLGSSLAPQLYAMESDGDYQVNSIADINQTKLGFKAGEDSEYTLTFTNENLETKYDKVYLIDLLKNTATDITQTGTTYTFTTGSNSPENRFEIVTNLDNRNNSEAKKEGLSLFSNQKIIVVNNQTSDAGTLNVYDATIGQLALNQKFEANRVSTFPTKLPAGLYILKATTSTEQVTITSLMK